MLMVRVLMVVEIVMFMVKVAMYESAMMVVIVMIILLVFVGVAVGRGRNQDPLDLDHREIKERSGKKVWEINFLLPSSTIKIHGRREVQNL